MTASTNNCKIEQGLSSAIYSGQVSHHRFSPKEHSFSYKVYLTYLNLNEIKKVFSLSRLFADCRSWAPIQFVRKNYLSPHIDDLQEAVRQKVIELGGEKPDGDIYLLSNLSYLGYCFNPVSFYYCYDRLGQLKYILSEITNTPWGERFCYLTEAHKKDSLFKKAFHVSPFMPMEMTYNWNFTTPNKKLDVQMESYSSGEKVFQAKLHLNHQPLKRSSLLKMAVIQPLIPVKVLFAIYWNAFLLKWKGVPTYTNPSNSLKEENRYES